MTLMKKKWFVFHVAPNKLKKCNNGYLNIILAARHLAAHDETTTTFCSVAVELRCFFAWLQFFVQN